MTKARSVAKLVDAIRTLEGGGFMVQRTFPTEELSELDPFLLLDEMGPTDYAPGQAKGAPDHPHRGFETVTYMLAGTFSHRDSHGHAGTINPGDVQWMTAGGGVVHSEMPEREFAKRGGLMHGFQLWVNLPKVDKMMKPRYQDVPAAKVPTVTSKDGLVDVRVIAGESMGASAVIDTRIPFTYLHFTIRPGGRVDQPIPRDHNGFVYTIDGEGLVGSTKVEDAQLALLANDGEHVSLSVPEDATAPWSFLLLAGKPIDEPVARWGPFVMNTREEIMEAVADYRAGRMGTIAPDA